MALVATIAFIIGLVVALKLKESRPVLPGEQRAAVQAYTIPETTEKEKSVARKESFGVTVDLYKLIRIALNDPYQREKVYNAVREGAMPASEILGAANLSDSDNPEWFTVFAGTSRQVQPGQEGFLLRNRRGDRVSLRLKRQEVKTHDAVTSPAAIPATVDGNELMRRALYEGDAAAAQALLQMSGTPQNPEQLFPEQRDDTDVGIELPEEYSDSPFDDITV